MGRIKNDSLYIFDSPASKFDKVIGSDAENAGRTKNYLLGELFALFNTLGGGGVFSYTYTADLADLDTIEGLVATNDSETDPDGVNLLRFSRTDLFGTDLRTLVENYNNNSDGVVLKVTSEDDPNLICAYTITGININTNWVEVSVLRHKNLNTLTFEVAKNFTLTFDLVNLDGFGGGGGATNTSQLVNDGDDGINPFISLQDLITDHTALSSIGINTHDEIDSHIADATIHFTEASINITESQISDLQSYLLTETDPIFTAWLATSPNISSFTNDVGYLTSFSELDPIFTASPSFSITNTNITNWNTAYGWGDHQLGGYLKIIDIDTFAELDGFISDAFLVKEGDNVSVFANDAGYLTSYTETDPIFVASPAGGILAGDIINWNNAFGWGDHSLVGYLTSYTETDPIFVASPAGGILAGDIINWNNAFGWGDHSLVGYLTSFDITTQTDPKYIRSDVDDSFVGVLTGGASARIVLENTNDAGIASTLHALQIGATSGFNVIFDNNEIQSRNNGAVADFFIQTDGGNLGIFENGVGILTVGGDTTIVGDITANAHITVGGLVTDFVKGDGSLDSTSYATTAGIGSEVEEENNFAGGETSWVLSGTPSASFPHRLYAGTTNGGGLILLDEGVDYTLVGSTITYLAPVLPIDSDEKHIIQYNTATVPLTYPTPYADVIYRNSDMWEAVDASAYYFKDRFTFDQRNLQLFIMTDIHGDVDRMNNGITLMNQFDTIDGGLNMGDTCINTWLDDYTFVDPYHTIGKPVLISIGNHDEGLYRTIASTGSSAQSYARFIQPYEVNIGGVHAGKSYYYKDWTTYKIRTINMYDMDDNDDIDPTDPLQYRVFKTHRIWSQAQLDWLEATLASTPTDYAVIVITHYPIEDQPNITVDYTCKLTDPKIVNWDAEANYVVGNPVADMMEAWITGTASGALSYALSGSTGEASYKPNLTVNVDFISRGTGHFITYLCGHVHQDGVGDLTGYTTQKIITINCTSSNKARNKYGSTQRKPGTRSEDLLTTMAFDTVNRQIKVVRLGAQFFTEDMRKMDYTTIDY